jgi:hypothetical protein
MRARSTWLFLALAPLVTAGVQGCSSDQLHAVGAGIHRQQCAKEVGRDDRAACQQFNLGSR